MSTKRREGAKGKKAPDGTVLCSCGCGRQPPKGRRTWFSQECVHEWRIKNDTAYIRQAIHSRDKGICAACGCDADEEFLRYRRRLNEAAKLLAWLEHRERQALREKYFMRPDSTDAHFQLWPEARWNARVDFLKLAKARRVEALRIANMEKLPWDTHKSSGWDVDHIHEVVKGGGQCSLENLQTLCHPCHKKKTAALIRELADRKKLIRNAQTCLNITTP